MVLAIFLDTSFIVAFMSKNDKHHVQAKNIIKQTLKENSDTKFIYSDYIFDELITLMKVMRISHEDITKNADFILKSQIWKRILISEDIFQKTWKLIKKYDDKEWSFTDVSCFVLMDSLDIKYFLSYDSHFLQYSKIAPWEK